MDRLPFVHSEINVGTHAPPRRHSVAPGRTVAITYGTYDLFHVGHVRLFRRIKERFGFLIVAVSTDEFNAGKGKQTLVSTLGLDGARRQLGDTIHDAITALTIFGSEANGLRETARFFATREN